MFGKMTCHNRRELLGWLDRGMRRSQGIGSPAPRKTPLQRQPGLQSYRSACVNTCPLQFKLVESKGNVDGLNEAVCPAMGRACDCGKGTPVLVWRMHAFTHAYVQDVKLH